MTNDVVSTKLYNSSRNSNSLGGLQQKRLECHVTAIGENAFIGSGAVILCGIRIGEGSMIAADSVVTKSVKRYNIVAGNPARVLRIITKK